MEKIFSLHKTFDIFNGASETVYSWVCKIEEGVKKVKAIFSNWNKRWNARNQLAKLDDRLLKDMGLYRHDVEYEINKPFWKA